MNYNTLITGEKKHMWQALLFPHITEEQLGETHSAYEQQTLIWT